MRPGSSIRIVKSPGFQKEDHVLLRHAKGTTTLQFDETSIQLPEMVPTGTAELWLIRRAMASGPRSIVLLSGPVIQSTRLERAESGWRLSIEGEGFGEAPERITVLVGKAGIAIQKLEHSRIVVLLQELDLRANVRVRVDGESSNAARLSAPKEGLA